MANKTQGRAIQNRTLMLAQMGILVAIMLVFHFTGIGFINIGPVSLTIMWIPIVIGAITLGPIAGAVLGGVFGATVLMAMGPLTQILIDANPVLTIFFVVVVRGLTVGFLSGLIFKALRKLDRSRTWSYVATGLITSLLNTFVFIAGTVLIFGGGNSALLEWGPIDDASRGAVFTTLVALVGVQAIIEAAICAVIAGVIARVLTTYLQKQR